MSEEQKPIKSLETPQEDAAGPTKSALKKKAKEEEKAKKAEERKRKEEEAKAAKAAADSVVCSRLSAVIRSQIDCHIGCGDRLLWETPITSISGRDS